MTEPHHHISAALECLGESDTMSETPDAADSVDAIVTNLRRIVRAVTLQSRAVSKRSGLSVAQLLTLRALAERPEGTTATDIRGIVQVTAGTLSGIVHKLVKRGLVERARDTEDRRRVLLFVTDAGLDLLSRGPSLLQEQVERRLAALGDDERSTILQSLERLAAMMDAEHVDASPILTDGSSLDG